MTALDWLAGERRWVAWRNERRGDKLTKVPYAPSGRRAKSDDPQTWGPRPAAKARARNIVNGLGGGVGIELGDLGNGVSIGGVDLDTCRELDGTFASWATEIIHAFHSYTEVSPSGTGAKIFFKYKTDALPIIRAAMGGSLHGREFKRANGGDHPPAIELHISRRYFTVTEDHLASTPDELTLVEAEQLFWLLREAGPAFVRAAGGQRANGGHDNSRSAVAFRKGAELRRAGKSFDEMVEALQADAETAGWVREKGLLDGRRELRRIWERAAQTATAASETALDDFYAYMPMHDYIFVPTRELWPATSVNARIPPPVIGVGADGGKKVISASAWLDQNRPVEQMTWAPGSPLIISNRLISNGGWIARVGVSCFNLYQPPNIELGDAAKAQRWLDHLHRIFPDDADHIVTWLAQRRQRPQEKINHALVLGGCQGVGKDTAIEPAKRAVGPWNFREVSPQQVVGRFNGFMKSVILRISEARDLGDLDRFKFYDHMKAYTAAPPDVLLVDEKFIREHSILNCCGVIITTNHKTNGIYLPADDRRHYVAWSDLTKEDFTAGYWADLWAWYEKGGDQHVAAYLDRLDLAGFDAKAPPPKTNAFWEIVDASRVPEDAELSDVLDDLGRPDTITITRLIIRAGDGFREWLSDRRNSRLIPHRLETCGYVAVRNRGARDGLWKVEGKRQVIYANADLPPAKRFQMAAEWAGVR